MPFLILAAIILAMATTESRAGEMFETKLSSECTNLAAGPFEPAFEGRETKLGEIDLALAIPACKAAVTSPEATGFDHYHMARVYFQAEQLTEWAQELRLSAEAGYAPAQATFGGQYIDGKFPQDYATGRYWLAKAADQGDVRGLVALGYMEWNGFGGPLDRDAAIRHEKQAADLGDEDGAANFASYSEQIANAQEPVDANGQTYGDTAEEVQRQEAEKRQEIERQNCQYNRAFGDAAAAWSGC